METTQLPREGNKKAKEIAERAEEKIEGAERALKHRVEEARDLVGDLRARAEVVMRDRPYLLPVAAGALGFGVGILVGSKRSRLVLITAAGSLLSEPIREQVTRIGRQFVRDVGIDVGGEHAEDIEEEGEPSIA